MVTAATRDILATIPGLVAPEDGEALAAMAATVPAGYAIIEIGAHRGLSTCWIARGSIEDGAGARVWSIDPWPMAGTDAPDAGGTWGEEGAMERHAANVAAVGATGLVVPVRGTGADLADEWDDRVPVGFWFHDADHAAAAVLHDFRAWERHMAPGCWVAVHDYYGSVPDGRGGWRRVDVHQPAVDVMLRSGDWSRPVIVGTADGAYGSPNLWMARRW